MRSTLTRSTIATILFFLFFMGGLGFLVRDQLLVSERYARFYRSYLLLHPGMIRTRVHSALGRPVYSCRYRGTNIEYFMPPEAVWQNLGGLTLSWDITADSPSEARDLEDLPNVYGAVKVAFDGSDRLVAFEWEPHLSSSFTDAMNALDSRLDVKRWP